MKNRLTCSTIWLVPTEEAFYNFDKNTDDPLGAYYSLCMEGFEQNKRLSARMNISLTSSSQAWSPATL